MAKRFLPAIITRFNYWTFEIASPKPSSLLAPTFQRLADYPKVKWIDRPGHKAIQRQIQQDFHLLLNASPEVWSKEVFPRFRVKLAGIANRRYYALKYYAEHDKEWKQDADAQEVLRQLSRGERTQIDQLSKRKWPERSKRPARRKRTWDTLLQTIARDQETFLKFCESPPESGELRGNDLRLYCSYSKQAIRVLGGGRLPRKSFFSVKWSDLSRTERREWKIKSLHYFHHALRNLREYRNRRPDVPWTSECTDRCRRIQQKLCL